MSDQEQVSSETVFCGDTPVPQDSRTCHCLLAIFIGFNLICDSFQDDDTGSCLTCGHEKNCHDNP